MSVRQALAPLNPNTQRNQSMIQPTKRFSTVMPPAAAGGGRMSLNVPKPQQRTSMVVPRNGRGLSMVGNGAQGRVDRRSITEKSTQVKYQKNIIKFLTQRGYTKPISTKILQSPTNKDFFSMFQFLMQQFEPGFQLGPKPEDEIPLILKQLRYPAQIAKNMFITVASPHIWPHLLAVLEWFVELANYFEILGCSETPEGLGKEGENPGEKLFLDYLGKAYQHYLAGEDNFSGLEGELVATLEAKKSLCRQEIEDAERTIASIGVEINALLEAQKHKIELEKKTADLKSDRLKFEQMVREFELYQSNMEKRHREIQEELSRIEAEIQSLTAEKEECSAIIQEQEENNIDAEKIAKEREKLEDQMKHATSLRIAAEQTTWEIETKLNKKIEETEKLVAGYNALATELGIVPVTAKYAEGRDLALEFNADTLTLSVDIKTEIKPIVRKLKEKFITSYNKGQAELLSLEEKKERAEEILNDKLEDLRSCQNKLKLEQTIVQGQQEENDLELRQKQEEIEILRKDIQRLRQSTNLALTQSQKSLQITEEQLNDLQAAQAKEREDLNNHALSVINTLLNHKTYVQEQLKTLAERFEQEKDAI